MPLPNMDKDTAAYAVSQPLLDALRTGETKIQDQQLQLATASELVRTIHVHVPSAVGEDGLRKHYQYLDAIVKAWRSATEVYNEVFAALAAVTASDPTVGREAADNHELFQRMANSANTAHRIAFEYDLSGVAAPLFDASAVLNAAASGETAEMHANATTGAARSTAKHSLDDDGPGTSTRTSKVAKMDLTAQTAIHGEPAKGGRTVIPSNNAVAVNKVSTKRERRREKAKQLKSGAIEKEHVKHDESTSATVPPVVEYEDVNDEVAARLAAKTEKRNQLKETAKAEKKRKRESMESVGSRTARAPKVNSEASVPIGKPQKKKSRTATESQASINPATDPLPTVQPNKREPPDEEGEHGSAAGLRKSKRVKS